MNPMKHRFLPTSLCLVALALTGWSQKPRPSLLDELPSASGKAAEVLAARLRREGPAGEARLAWLEYFAGVPSRRHRALAAMRRAMEPGARQRPTALTALVALEVDAAEGRDEGADRAALRLLQLAPNDPAGELAARQLSGDLDQTGRLLLESAPELRRLLGRHLADPTTAYMLGRPLLALLHAPGVDLDTRQALALSGRLQDWTLYGPAGDWANLDFDHPLGIVRSDSAVLPKSVHGSYRYDATGGEVRFPGDWGQQGIDYAVTFVDNPAAQPVSLRLFSEASARLFVNGHAVLTNDRRARYTPAARTARIWLPAGWNRIVVQLGGEAERNFTLMLRPERTPAGKGLASAYSAGARVNTEAARVLAAPETVATWAHARLAERPAAPVALWADAVWRLQDDDSETARYELQQAARVEPQAVPVWLALAQDYGLLPDASGSWAATQIVRAAKAALAADPRAISAYERLGQVAQSEGKPEQAMRAYARCARRGDAVCDWADFRLAVTQGWTPEATDALRHGLAESASNWPRIEEALTFLTAAGQSARLQRLRDRIQKDPRASAVLGEYDLHHGHPRAAVRELTLAMRQAPSSATLRRDSLDALARTNPSAQAAAVAAKRALADFPYDWRLANQADELLLQVDPKAGLAALRATQDHRNLFRNEADFLAHDKFWAPWYHSAASVIQNAPGKAQYPNASAILVLDQMVDRINPDSTRDSYIHQIFRVLDSTGIQLHQTVKLPPGSDLIRVRTIKADGTVLLPERLSNLSEITMPGLEPGDFVETEYVMHEGPSRIVPGTLDNDMFFVFNSDKEPYNYSDYIVLTPDSYPLAIETRRFPSPPVVEHRDGWTSHEWLVQKTRFLAREPNMPPVQTLVPKVWISSPLRWSQIADYFADHLPDVARTTVEMQHQAEALVAGKTSNQARADAIFTWVVNNIQNGPGNVLSPARQYFTDRNGNRLATFMALLDAAHVPFQLVLARPVTDQESLQIPSLYAFPYPLVRVGRKNGGGWYDLNGEFAALNYIAPAFRGGLGLAVGDSSRGAKPARATGPSAAPAAPAAPAAEAANSTVTRELERGVFIHVPGGASTLDGVVERVRGTVASDGSAQLHVALEFRGPTGESIREALSQQPDSRLPQIYQQMLAANYPNAIASGGSIAHRNQHNTALIIRVDGTVPDFLQIQGGQWELAHLANSAGLLRRYAPLATRSEPLVIPGDTFEVTSVNLTFAPSFTQIQPPADSNLSSAYGQFTAHYRVQSHQLSLQRTLDLNATVIAPDQYAAFRQFAEAVDSQGRQQISGTIAASAAAAPAGQ